MGEVLLIFNPQSRCDTTIRDKTQQGVSSSYKILTQRRFEIACLYDWILRKLNYMLGDFFAVVR